MKRLLPLTLGSLFASLTLYAQSISVKDTIMTTYPFGDPDPVARMGGIYPYWKFQKFSLEPCEQSWKMVVLENPYLRVKIFPQIGGKVWSIYDKKAGQELVYDNDVVKFRQIALRGPWTSGGIEFNYGVIGHSPSCSTPVDYKTEYKEDGSVSCYIGVMDLTSRSRWTVEINLPKDAAYCRTSSIWYNLSGEWQPYYSWNNAAVRTSDDLVLIYPADNAIGHLGELETFPINEQGKDISILANQNYGRDKSYHMIGSHKSFFGAYYPGDDWASMHWSLRDDKLGRKYFSWAQSEQGDIWIDLLTDSRPQYVEVQSGRLYNQNEVASCANTPYRQILFNPYGTEEWSDWYMSAKGIGPIDNLNPDAAVSVKDKHIGICPIKPADGILSVCDSTGKEIFREQLSLTPMEPLNFDVEGKPQTIRLNGRILYQDNDEILSRPQSRIEGYDPESIEALCLLSRNLLGLRMYPEAEAAADKALAKDEFNLDALCLKTALLYRRMAYDDSYRFSDKALAIDQYCPEAGYFGALSAMELGKDYDAMDRLEVASITPGTLRTACHTELSRICLQRGDTLTAEHYARKALVSNGRNLTALMLLCAMNREDEEKIARYDPLSHFPQALRYLRGEIDKASLRADFQEELPWEDYVELALFFHSIGDDSGASRILEASDRNILTDLWIAYLENDPDLIPEALKQPLDFAFPYRKESCNMLQWVIDKSDCWQGRYLLAMLKDYYGYKDEAKELLAGLQASYAPLYAYRYTLTREQADIRKAFTLDRKNLIYRRMLTADLTKRGEYTKAVDLLKGYYAAHPDDFRIGDALIDAYMGLGRYEDAEKIIDKITYLPFENMRASHEKYRHIKLELSKRAYEKGDIEKALSLIDEALLWPRRLGVGKPYDNLIDTTAEQVLRQKIEERQPLR